MGDDGACPHESIFSQGDATEDGGIRPNRGAAPHEGRAVFSSSGHMAAWVGYVGKDHRWTQENIVLQGDTGVNGYVILDLYPVADAHAGGDKYVLSDVAIFADLCVLHHVAKMPDFGSSSNVCPIVHVRRFVQEIICHIIQTESSFQIGMNFVITRRGWGCADAMGQLDGRARVRYAKTSSCQGFLIDARMQIGKPSRKFDFLPVYGD